jgi:hypothetical protein
MSARTSFVRRPQSRFAAACPHCNAPAGSPCRGIDGNPLAGVHFQRSTTLRREIRAAIDFYRSMGLKNSSQLSVRSSQKGGMQ